MNYSVLPPEINSLRMFTGAGSAPMLAALTVLADEFGDGAPVPMLPGSWGPDLVGVAGDGGVVSV